MTELEENEGLALLLLFFFFSRIVVSDLNSADGKIDHSTMKQTAIEVLQNKSVSCEMLH